MDADGDYIPRSVLRGNPRSIVAWNAWKQLKYNGKSKSPPTDKGIHGPPVFVSANNGPQLR